MKNVLLLVLISCSFININANESNNERRYEILWGTEASQRGIVFESEGIRYETVGAQIDNDDYVYGVKVIRKENGYKGNIVIPNYVTYKNKKYLVIGIGKAAFRTNKKMRNIILPDSLIYIDEYAFDQCKGLTSISFPNSIKYMGHGSFFHCEKLRKIVLPNSLVSLGKHVFGWNYNLREIVIPSSIKTFNIWNFYFCEKLQKILSCGVNPPLLVDTKTSIDHMGIKPREISLYVPREAIKDYSEAVGWRSFDIKISDCDELP